MTEAQRRQILYGDPDFVAPERIPLRAGPLHLFYEDGDLKYICYGKRELVRRIYGAVRDGRWATIPGERTEVERTVGPDSFRIIYEARHRDEEKGVDFTWRATLSGTADGVVTFDLHGEAAAPFESNRTGICVLHPLEDAGRTVTVRHTGDETEQGMYPELILPDQPFFHIASLTQEIAPGVAFTIGFSGEVFEMEDQRNYLDASYKTYSRPQSWPKPYTVKPGEPVHQTVTVSVSGDVETLPTPEPSPVEVTIGTKTLGPPPSLGLMLPPDGVVPEDAGAEQWFASSGGHLRIDLDLSQDGWREALNRAVMFAGSVAAKQERPCDLLIGLRRADLLPEDFKAPEAIAAFLLLLPSPEALKQAQKVLLPTPLYFASDRNFTELNRNRPQPGPVEGVAFSCNPQVHSSDNTSIMETPYTLDVILRTIRSYGGDFSIAVGPTYLSGYRKRSDSRHWGLLGAAWATAIACHAAQGGIQYLTLFDLAGPKGIPEGDQAWNPFRNTDLPGEVLETKNSDPLRIACLALRKDDAVTIQLVNLTAEEQAVKLDGLPYSRIEVLQCRDETDPTGYTLALPEEQNLSDGFSLTLKPYGLVAIWNAGSPTG